MSLSLFKVVADYYSPNYFNLYIRKPYRILKKNIAERFQIKKGPCLEYVPIYVK